MLGLRVDASKRLVSLSQASLPAWLNTLEIRSLRVVDASVDLRITRGRYSATVEVTGQHGEVDVVVRK